MSQSRTGSIVETIFGTAVGYVVAVISQVLIFPLFGMSLTLSQDAGMAAIFTVISLARGYLVRRLFNYLHVGRQSKASAQEVDEAVQFIQREMHKCIDRVYKPIPIETIEIQDPHIAEFVDFERKIRERVATSTGVPRHCLRDDTQ